MNGAATAVRIDDVSVTYRRGRGESVDALRSVQLDIASGELVVLLGPSGCGKSTLLKCIAGLLRPASGSIDLGGQRVVEADAGVCLAPNRRDVGLVFQTYALWPHMTVRGNVEYPLRARKLKDDLKSGAADRILALLQCDALADRYPAELSGGQQQRVALARALVSRPSVLLFDEPLSNLDALLRTAVRAQIKELHKQLGFTGIYVTHDQVEALSLADRVAVMQDGHIVQLSTPRELFQRPATCYVADFVGVKNQLKLTSDGQHTWCAGSREDCAVAVRPPTGEYTVYFRAESVHVTDQELAAVDRPEDVGIYLRNGVITRSLYEGSESEYFADFGAMQVRMLAASESRLAAEGARINAFVYAADLLLYDSNDNLAAVEPSPAAATR